MLGTGNPNEEKGILYTFLYEKRCADQSASPSRRNQR